MTAAPDELSDEDAYRAALTSPAAGATPASIEAFYKAKLDIRTGQIAADHALQKALRDADFASLQKYYDTYVDVAKGSLDRAKSGAEAVRTAAAAIGTIYAAILALAFSVNKPLPPRGLIPALFLGIAIVMSTAYVAFLMRDPRVVPWAAGRASTRASMRERTTSLLEWISQNVYYKRYALRTSVIALGFGVAFLPVAFISLGSGTAPTPSEASLQAWPGTPTAVSDPALQEILYQAQVTEAQELRKAQLQAAPGESPRDIGFWIVYGLALIGIISTFFHERVARLLGFDLDQPPGTPGSGAPVPPTIPAE